MSTKTQTTTTHYHIQKRRRAEFIDEWRKYRQTVIRKEDVTTRLSAQPFLDWLGSVGLGPEVAMRVPNA